MDYRTEEDLLGKMNVSDEMYYGIHTKRALQNFQISNSTLKEYPNFIRGLILTKKACAAANEELGTIPKDKTQMISQACDHILDNLQSYLPYFPIDVFQGGAGTSSNMNTNEVIANVALTQNGHKKGAYDILDPNDHVNKCQSTNDVYPTGFRVSIFLYMNQLIEKMQHLITSLETKSKEFSDVLKMGRTQLQDAVPMSLG
ncbi:MAG: lyase family protein, partial [Bacteroidia bacterium]